LQCAEIQGRCTCGKFGAWSRHRPDYPMMDQKISGKLSTRCCDSDTG
jgi:hypothetical protein